MENTTMKAMVLHQQKHPLELETLPIPTPTSQQLLIKVSACGVCRTDLHVVDGDLKEPKLPLIPGHQIVGEIVYMGNAVSGFELGQRVGVPWLGGSCGHCAYCMERQENLCDHAVYTGYQLDGGFAEYCVADARYAFSLPEGYSDLSVAPLLCAGLIGYRAYRMCGNAKKIGIYGFGAAAHLLTQLARFEQKEVYAFTREGDSEAQSFARSLGAVWAGASEEQPPTELDAAIIFAPAGELVPIALQRIKKGGIVVCGGIHMSDIPSFPYKWLWGERTVCSVANLTRQDGEEYLPLAAAVPVKTETHIFPLEQINEALDTLRSGKVTGAIVIEINSSQ